MSKKSLRNSTIYQVFVRNHSKEGTLQALIADLDRIQDLGIDILYLLPLHPIGEVARKGKAGSPYAIKDYRAIHPDLGTMEDFESLIKEAHRRGLKVMIDIVFNHTSRDSVLLKEHPEWFFLENGEPKNRVGDWSDIADLNFDVPELWDYLIETLLFYVKKGVDGFRCDVAPIIPLEFWKKAREEVAKINPDVIWLSESIEPEFIKSMRAQGYQAYSDAEMYQAFDILYDYDVYPELKKYLEMRGTFRQYVEAVKRQEYLYPVDYLKAHFLDNHDQERIASLVKDQYQLHNLIAWSFFQPGVGFIYAGGENALTHKPNLFEHDPLDWEEHNPETYLLVQRLVQLKKEPIFLEKTSFDIEMYFPKDVLLATLSSKSEKLLGIFNFSGGKAKVILPINQIEVIDQISGKVYPVKKKVISITEPVIIKIA
ncbi:MAG: alpha-amylase family glycosyl hydrolase [Bacilli bacterium]